MKLAYSTQHMKHNMNQVAESATVVTALENLTKLFQEEGTVWNTAGEEDVFLSSSADKARILFKSANIGCGLLANLDKDDALPEIAAELIYESAVVALDGACPSEIFFTYDEEDERRQEKQLSNEKIEQDIQVAVNSLLSAIDLEIDSRWLDLSTEYTVERESALNELASAEGMRALSKYDNDPLGLWLSIFYQRRMFVPSIDIEDVAFIELYRQARLGGAEIESALNEATARYKELGIDCHNAYDFLYQRG